MAAPAIDKQLDAASVAGSDCARKVRLDIERRDDLALVDKAPQLLAVGHAMHLGDEVGPIEPCLQFMGPAARILIMYGDLDIAHFPQICKGACREMVVQYG